MLKVEKNMTKRAGFIAVVVAAALAVVPWMSSVALAIDSLKPGPF
jgi:lipopolysaccharide/colanic/teichoic acid biosynthesis glycosyltransferase